MSVYENTRDCQNHKCKRQGSNPRNEEDLHWQSTLLQFAPRPRANNCSCRISHHLYKSCDHAFGSSSPISQRKLQLLAFLVFSCVYRNLTVTIAQAFFPAIIFGYVLKSRIRILFPTQTAEFTKAVFVFVADHHVISRVSVVCSTSQVFVGLINEIKTRKTLTHWIPIHQSTVAVHTTQAFRITSIIRRYPFRQPIPITPRPRPRLVGNGK
ncbi:hypothetical protein COLO4_27440 [Corchorus olitorius]|uniref:Uncharacterized protein n=1 Tax=Corchorus olitorius TaxID=93759 RepID=A0A1R3HR17_9ROSI|nr:hypothetical protein COLO4_27440 [Corchorus olitorius]